MSADGPLVVARTAFTCGTCNVGFVADIPVISGRREDAIGIARDGFLEVVCPSCGARVQPGNPILLVRDTTPRFAFIPTDDDSPDQNARVARTLMAQVADGFDVAPELLLEGCTWVPRVIVAGLDGPAAEDPDFSLVLRAAEAAPSGRVSEAIGEVLRAADVAELADVVRRHPVMLTDFAEDQLIELTDKEDLGGDLRRHLSQLNEILREFRQWGVGRAVDRHRADLARETGGMERLPLELQQEISHLYRGAQHQDDYDETVTRLQRVLAKFPADEAPRLWGQLHGLLGQLLLERGSSGRRRRRDVELAIEAYTVARDVHEPERPLEWTWAQKSLSCALLSREKGDPQRNEAAAIAGLEACANRQGELGELSECVSTLVLLADVLLELRPVVAAADRALGLLVRVVELTWATPTDPSLTAAMHRLRELAPGTSDPDRSVELHHALGLGYQALTNAMPSDLGAVIDLAIAHWTEEAQLRAQAGDTAKWAEVTAALANLYRRRSSGHPADNLQRAADLLTRALPYLTRDGNGNARARAHCELALSYCEQPGLDDRVSRAEGELRRAEEELAAHAEPVDLRLHAESVAHVAATKGLETGDHDDLVAARNLCQAALGVTPREQTWRWAEQQSLLASVYVALALFGETPPDDAVDAMQVVLQVYKLESAPQRRRVALQNLGTLHAERGEWREASTAFADGIVASERALDSLWQEGSRLAEVREANRLYHAQCYALVRLGRCDEAFRVLERSWSRLNRQWWLPEVYFEMTQEQRDYVDALRQNTRIYEAEARRTIAETDRAAVNDTLASARAEWSRLFALLTEHDPTTAELTTALPPGGAAVMPVLTDLGSLVFVVPTSTATVTEAHVVELPEVTPATLHRLTRGSREKPGWLMNRVVLQGDDGSAEWQEFRGRFDQQTSELLEVLSQAVVGPVVERLRTLGVAGDTEVVIVPADDLGSFPVHVAPLPDGTAALDHFVFSYAPSLLAHRLCKDRAPPEERPPQRAVAFIDPSGDLRGARSEAEVLQRMVTGEFVPVSGSDASVDRVVAEAPGADLLHFACHGHHLFASAYASGLVMAGQELLTIDWLRGRVHLQGCRLVVMSACDSGVTDFLIDPSESVGLPSALVEAGAAAVVGTMWSVADDHASRLVARFYELHLGSRLPPARALCLAQREMRDVGASSGPYSWGGFFVVGA